MATAARPVISDPAHAAFAELSEADAGAGLSRIRGALYQLDCQINNAVLHIRDEGGRAVRLLIADPNKITIRNQPGSSVNLNCGAHAPEKQVIVDFVGQAGKDTAGEVRAVEFLQ